MDEEDETAKTERNIAEIDEQMYVLNFCEILITIYMQYLHF